MVIKNSTIHILFPGIGELARALLHIAFNAVQLLMCADLHPFDTFFFSFDSFFPFDWQHFFWVE